MLNQHLCNTKMQKNKKEEINPKLWMTTMLSSHQSTEKNMIQKNKFG